MHESLPPWAKLGDLSFRWWADSSVGHRRAQNEDAWLDRAGMFVVADGMGGHEGGREASSLTVQLWEQQAERLPLKLEAVEALVGLSNTRVRERGLLDNLTSMGTTLVGLVAIDNGGELALAVVNVGDSRCYVADPASGLTLITHDHSVAQELVDAGRLTAAEAAVHPDRNIVTRSIGTQEAVYADFVVLPRQEARRFLLCSDGVWGELAEAELHDCLREDDPRAAVEALLRLVLAGPAPDNATAVVVDVAWSPIHRVAAADLAQATTGPRRADPRTPQDG